eukprot:g30045.t1
MFLEMGPLAGPCPHAVFVFQVLSSELPHMAIPQTLIPDRELIRMEIPQTLMPDRELIHREIPQTPIPDRAHTQGDPTPINLKEPLYRKIPHTLIPDRELIHRNIPQTPIPDRDPCTERSQTELLHRFRIPYHGEKLLAIYLIYASHGIIDLYKV